MKYSILADVYEELEKTSSKLGKTKIIADILKKTSDEELERVVLLLRGSVFPSWSDEELGIANQLVIKSVFKAYGINEKEVVKSFKKTGDLGLTLEEFSKQKKQKTLIKEELTVKRVFENLKKIAEQTGKGSQERKMNLVAELISQASPKEVRYIVRTILFQLRVGVAEGSCRRNSKRFHSSSL